jgi:hypothetical protein
MTMAMVLPTGQDKAEVNMLKHWQEPADGLRWDHFLLPVGDFQATVDVTRMKAVMNLCSHQDFQSPGPHPCPGVRDHASRGGNGAIRIKWIAG